MRHHVEAPGPRIGQQCARVPVLSKPTTEADAAMLSPDAFRARLDAARAAARDWVLRHRANAEIENVEAETFWRIAAAPLATNACAFEIVVHPAQQTCDMSIGEETFEGIAVTPELIPELLEAISAGEVDSLVRQTAATGALHSIETAIGRGRVLWQDRRVLGAIARQVPDEACTVARRSFRPYHL